MADKNLTDFLGAWASAIKARLPAEELPAEKLEPELTLDHTALTTAPAVIDGVNYNGTISSSPSYSSGANVISDYFLEKGDNFRFAVPFTYVNSSPPVSCRAYLRTDGVDTDFNCTMEVNHSEKSGVLYPYFSNKHNTNDYYYNTNEWKFLRFDVSFAENAEYKAKTFKFWNVYLRKRS